MELKIGGIWILFMQQFVHTARYDFNDLDTNGWLLTYTFIGFTFAVVYYLITRAKQIALKRWNLFKVISIVLFSLNTILLMMWNHSLTMAYVALSIGLLLTIFVLLLINKQED